MSRSHVAITLSVAAHAALGAVGATVAATSPAPVRDAVRLPVVEVRPIDVEVYVEPAPAAHALAAPGPGTSRGGSVRAAAAARVVVVAAPVEAPVAVPVVPVPSVRTITELAEPAPRAITPGTTVPEHGTFTMRVDPDGRAHLTDRPNLRFALGTSAKTREEARAEHWLEAHREQSNAVEMKLPPAGATIATFDVTDWAMRAGGGDPYAHEKLKVLDATRDARAEIRARHREQQALQTPRLVRATLDDIAALAPAPRSAALVELWRDCDDSTAGEIARATIVEYVRTHAVFSAADRAAILSR